MENNKWLWMSPGIPVHKTWDLYWYTLSERKPRLHPLRPSSAHQLQANNNMVTMVTIYNNMIFLPQSESLIWRSFRLSSDCFALVVDDDIEHAIAWRIFPRECRLLLRQHSAKNVCVDRRLWFFFHSEFSFLKPTLSIIQQTTVNVFLFVEY